MGEVYKARDTRLERSVAIKVLPARLAADPQFQRRFDREARAISRLSDSHICTIHDVGSQDGSSYLVMEFVEGDTLSRWLGQADRPSIGAVLNVALQVARALVAAHAAGIVHRDIKPANAIVRPDGSVKVLDFGIAKLVEQPADDAVTVASGQTAAGVVVGTAKYMSPEQARGTNVDARTDIFSFGVLLYEMLSGRTPFEADTVTDTIVAILQREPAPLAERRADCSAELQRVVSKCLAKDVSRRYSSARDLVAELERVVAMTHEAPATSGPSIAVLPFVNMSADPENEYFCDGIAEDLIGALTKIGRLRVAARTSAFSFKGKNADLKDVGRTLRVGTVLEGSVRKAGNRLRVTAQLVDVAGGYQLWSERYDRQLEDVFEIQDEISLAIVTALKVHLLGDEKAALVKRHTENVDAFQLYLRGRHHWHKWSVEGLAKAKECMGQAIALDPNYALAFVGLADCYLASGAAGLMSPDEVVPEAKPALTRALTLDPELDEAWALLCVAHMNGWDWPAAEHAVARALELNPNLGHTHSIDACLQMYHQGRLDRALESARRSVELDPLAPLWNYYLALAHVGLGQADAAREVVRAMLDFDPDNWMAHHVRGMLLVGEGKRAEAVSVLEDAAQCSGQAANMVGALACALGLAGESARAERCLSDLIARAERGYTPALSIASAYCGLGQTDAAFEWMEKSYAQRDIWLRITQWNPLFASLRNDPRMLELQRRMGLAT
jgi:serine/threonine-protein kinase